MKSYFSNLKRSNFPFGIYLIMFASIAVYFLIMAGNADPKHFINVLRQNAPLGIAAIGQTIVLLIGGVDLSMGSVISITNIIACAVMVGDPSKISITVIVCFAFALFIGLLNGLAISKIKMPAFLATEAMAIVIQGVYLLYTGGSPGGRIAEEFRVISDGWVLNLVPIAFIIWVSLWVIVSVVLNKTVTGRRIFISGGNPIAGRLSGINTDWYIIGCFMASAALACVTGLLLSAYVGVTSSGIGESYTLATLACVVIGGTAFTGGKGSVEGTFAGVMIMVVLQTILSMLGVPSAGRQVIEGVMVLIILAINLNRPSRPAHFYSGKNKIKEN